MKAGDGGLPDYRLLGGFSFRCLPGCGLCCYTTPAVAPQERPRLVQLDPDVPLHETSAGWAQIASRPRGGACHFLVNERCTCHEVRPATCEEFPLTVHVGSRVQISVVFTCPGVELSGLTREWNADGSDGVSPSLHAEIAAVELELGRARSSGQLRWAGQRRSTIERRLEKKGSWQPEEEIRMRLHPHLANLVPDRIPPEEVPDVEAPLESLPMFFDPKLGRVAVRPHTGGVEFLSLRETGGIARALGVLAPPTQTPPLEVDARELLLGYMSYLLERDATLGAAYEFLLRSEPELPADVVAADLQAIATQVLRMATLRRALVSDRRGALSVHDVENGIRATDMDILDRPSSGLRL